METPDEFRIPLPLRQLVPPLLVLRYLPYLPYPPPDSPIAPSYSNNTKQTHRLEARSVGLLVGVHVISRGPQEKTLDF